MTESLTEFVDRVRRHYDDGCFACGRDNPIGLHMDDFELQGDDVIARFKPRDHYRGSSGVLHGGVAATAIDEILVWAGILTERVMTVTGTMELRYRKPVPMDEELVVSARVDDRSGRRLKVSGEMTAGDDRLVTGGGLYVVVAELDELLAEGHGDPR